MPGHPSKHAHPPSLSPRAKKARTSLLSVRESSRTQSELVDPFNAPSPPDTTLEESPLLTPERARTALRKQNKGLVDPVPLSKIDQLSACGVGNDVDLPQLVVVGQQSSGKSSVLEGLTGIPFPRAAELCTCFATQITFRRAETTRIRAYINPSQLCSAEKLEVKKAWSREMTSLDPVEFAKMIEEVMKVMKAGPEFKGKGDSIFSNDVFCIDVSGPEEEHFSIVDVPGTFKRTEQGVTTKADISFVQDMVFGYMENPRSIMLVVVPCNTDIATQDIVEKAEELDPQGDRTLGVLTKPDIVDKGAEQPVLDIMEGKKQKLKLGWHVLRNRGQKDLGQSTEARNAEEASFFRQNKPWNQLDRTKVGIEALQARLQEILAGHLRREFPKVKKDIIARLDEAMRNMEVLGQKRETHTEKLQYLLGIATEYRELAEAARDGHYNRSDIFDIEETRLATFAVERSERFARQVEDFGHHFKFLDPTRDKQTEGENGSEVVPAAKDKQQHPTRELVTPEDIQDLLPAEIMYTKPLRPDAKWLEHMWRKARGYEIGTFPAHLVGMMMKTQAKKWRAFATGYVADIICSVHTFTLEVLKNKVPEERTRNALLSVLIEDLKASYKAALDQVEFLLTVELDGDPATHNHYFNDELEKRREARTKAAAEHKAFHVPTDSLAESQKVIRIDDIGSRRSIGNAEHMVQEIQDVLVCYYKVARKRFVDNVRMQAVDFYLMKGPVSPLRLFAPTFVSHLDAEHLELIAGEEPRRIRERRTLEKQIKRLEQGRKILQ